jgi:hypothetical protein
MKTKKKLELKDHEEIAEWLSNPTSVKAVCMIQNAYGSSSEAGKLAERLHKLISRLKSGMEEMCYADGFADVATKLYYPRSGQ